MKTFPKSSHFLSFTKDYWTYIGQWQQPTLSNCLWCYWHNTNATKELFPNTTFHSWLNPDCQFWMVKIDLESFNKTIEEFANNHKKIEDFIEKLNVVGKRTKKQSLKILETKDENQEYATKLFRVYKELIGVWTCTWLFGDEIGKYLVKRKIHSEEELLQIINHKAKSTWLADEYKSIKKIAEFVKNKNKGPKMKKDVEKIIADDPLLSQRVKSHIANYDWYGTHHFMGQAYDFEKCIAEIVDYLNKKSANKKIDETKIAPIKHPLVNLLIALTYWRTHMAEVSSKVVYRSRKKLQKIAGLIGVSYEDLLFLTDQEIVRAIRDNDKFSFQEIIAKRKKGQGCYLNEDGSLAVYIGPQLRKITNNLTVDHFRDTEELKGLVACRGGIVSGRVAVLMSPQDFKNFQKGDILVTPETSPDFVPFMQKAKAVITDRGGVTSHAAIISREIGVPCIIGTHFATQKLKTGMMIEVDSDNGLVKIIS